MSTPPRPPFTGGAILLGAPAPAALAVRFLDGLRRELGRAPAGDDIRARMALLDATRAELAQAAGKADGR